MYCKFLSNFAFSKIHFFHYEIMAPCNYFYNYTSMHLIIGCWQKILYNSTIASNLLPSPPKNEKWYQLKGKSRFHKRFDNMTPPCYPLITLSAAVKQKKRGFFFASTGSAIFFGPIRKIIFFKVYYWYHQNLCF